MRAHFPQKYDPTLTKRKEAKEKIDCGISVVFKYAPFNLSFLFLAHYCTVKKKGGEGECMQLNKYKDLLSVQDLTEIFGVSKQTIYKNIKAGKFGTPIRIGRAFKIPRIYIWNKFFASYQ